MNAVLNTLLIFYTAPRSILISNFYFKKNKNNACAINKLDYFCTERPGNRVTLLPLKPIAPDWLLHFLGGTVLRKTLMLALVLKLITATLRHSFPPFLRVS